MNVAFKFLQYLGRDRFVTTEPCSAINSSEKTNNGVYKTKSGYQVLISVLGHSPRNTGSFATAAAASDAYGLQCSRLQQQIPRVLSRDDDEWDLPGYSHAPHHSKTPACRNNGEHHSDTTQCNIKWPCTAAAQDTLAQGLGQLADNIGEQRVWKSRVYSRLPRIEFGQETSAPSQCHASVSKPNSSAVTPPVNMFKNLVVTERIYSTHDSFSRTKASTGVGLLRNRPMYGRHLPPKKRMELHEIN